MKIKKVLFLTPRGSDKYLGGVEKHVKILTTELRQKGIRVGELSLSEAIDCHVAGAPRNDRVRGKIKAWQYLWKNRKLILDSDIIHVHDVFWWYSPFRFLFFWKPVFVTFHGWEGVYPPSRSAILQKKLADVLCRGSIGVGKYLEKWYGIKLDKITCGVFDSQNLQNLLRTVLSERGLSSRSASRSARQIMFLGRLEEVNGIEVVLQTANLLRSDLPVGDQTSQVKTLRFRYIFVGGGSYRRQCEKYGKASGMVKNVNQYLEKADLVIASSYLAIMEAMAMGKPVIAIANNPLKWDYLNCHPMAKRMKIVETAEQLANLLRTVLPGIPSKFKGQSSTAREWAKEQTPEKLAELYLKLWKK